MPLCPAFLWPTRPLPFASPHVCAESLAIPEEVKHEAGAHGGVVQEVSHSLTEAILGRTHVLYVTRVQKERFEREADYDAVKDAFIITKETMTKVRRSLRKKASRRVGRWGNHPSLNVKLILCATAPFTWIYVDST